MDYKGDYDMGYGSGYGQGFEDGKRQGMDDAFFLAEQEIEERLAKFYVEIRELNARLDYLEGVLREG